MGRSASGRRGLWSTAAGAEVYAVGNVAQASRDELRWTSTRLLQRWSVVKTVNGKPRCGNRGLAERFAFTAQRAV